jgi:hypothetical protein
MRAKDRTQGGKSCHRQVLPQEAQSCAEEWLVAALDCEVQGYKCTTSVLLRILFWAASHAASVTAACCAWAEEGPGDQTIRDAIRGFLPQRISTLEQRLHAALTDHLPRRLRRGARRIAIDWHQIPYHGEPHKNQNELRRTKPQQGTTSFHVYATACIVDHGERYTIALTRVSKSDTNQSVLLRLLERIEGLSLRIKMLLMDRQFFAAAVIQQLQQKNIPFVMPVVVRGRKPKTPKKPTGLRAMQKAQPGWYSHSQKHGQGVMNYSVCVVWRMVTHPRKKTRSRQVMLFACWKIRSSPNEIRELYRRRFGIEASYRQLKQARIRTSTRDPLVRLFYVGLALVLRNVWVWLCSSMTTSSNQPTSGPRRSRLTLLKLLCWLSSILLHSEIRSGWDRIGKY